MGRTRKPIDPQTAYARWVAVAEGAIIGELARHCSSWGQMALAAGVDRRWLRRRAQELETELGIDLSPTGVSGQTPVEGGGEGPDDADATTGP